MRRALPLILIGPLLGCQIPTDATVSLSPEAETIVFGRLDGEDRRIIVTTAAAFAEGGAVAVQGASPAAEYAFFEYAHPPEELMLPIGQIENQAGEESERYLPEPSRRQNWTDSVWQNGDRSAVLDDFRLKNLSPGLCPPPSCFARVDGNLLCRPCDDVMLDSIAAPDEVTLPQACGTRDALGCAQEVASCSDEVASCAGVKVPSDLGCGCVMGLPANPRNQDYVDTATGTGGNGSFGHAYNCIEDAGFGADVSIVIVGNYDAALADCARELNYSGNISIQGLDHEARISAVELKAQAGMITLDNIRVGNVVLDTESVSVTRTYFENRLVTPASTALTGGPVQFESGLSVFGTAELDGVVAFSDGEHPAIQGESGSTLELAGFHLEATQPESVAIDTVGEATLERGTVMSYEPNRLTGGAHLQEVVFVAQTENQVLISEGDFHFERSLIWNSRGGGLSNQTGAANIVNVTILAGAGADGAATIDATGHSTVARLDVQAQSALADIAQLVTITVGADAADSSIEDIAVEAAGGTALRIVNNTNAHYRRISVNGEGIVGLAFLGKTSAAVPADVSDLSVTGAFNVGTSIADSGAQFFGLFVGMSEPDSCGIELRHGGKGTFTDVMIQSLGRAVCTCDNVLETNETDLSMTHFIIETPGVAFDFRDPIKPGSIRLEDGHIADSEIFLSSPDIFDSKQAGEIVRGVRLNSVRAFAKTAAAQQCSGL